MSDPNDETVDMYHRGGEWAQSSPDKPFPLTPLEAWYVMRGYAVKPKAGCDVDTFLTLPGSLELHDGYIVLREP